MLGERGLGAGQDARRGDRQRADGGLRRRGGRYPFGIESRAGAGRELREGRERGLELRDDLRVGASARRELTERLRPDDVVHRAVQPDDDRAERFGAGRGVGRQLVRERFERLQLRQQVRHRRRQRDGRREERVVRFAPQRHARRRRAAHELRVPLEHVDQIGIHRRFGERVELRGVGHLPGHDEKHVGHVARPGADERVERARQGRQDRAPQDRRRVALEASEQRFGRPERTLAQARSPARVPFPVLDVAVDEVEHRAEAPEAEGRVTWRDERGARLTPTKTATPLGGSGFDSRTRIHSLRRSRSASSASSCWRKASDAAPRWSTSDRTFRSRSVASRSRSAASDARRAIDPARALSPASSFCETASSVSIWALVVSRTLRPSWYAARALVGGKEEHGALDVVADRRVLARLAGEVAHQVSRRALRRRRRGRPGSASRAS